MEVRLETLGHCPDAVLLLDNGEVAQLAHRLQDGIVQLDHGCQALDRLFQLDLAAGDFEDRCIGREGGRGRVQRVDEEQISLDSVGKKQEDDVLMRERERLSGPGRPKRAS